MNITQAQKDYFTHSQIRDRAGALIPCYHYTLATFDRFDPARIGGQSGDHGYFGEGFYFTGMPRFNSCCWSYDGRKPIRLECYLDIHEPFVMDRLHRGYDCDDPYSVYDSYRFLGYLKDNADDEDDRLRIVIDMEDDFPAYARANPQEYEDYPDYEYLVEAFGAGDIGFYDKGPSGASLADLYDKAERERDIVTPYNLTFGDIHRGLLEDYSALVTAYAQENGCDGIMSDTGDQPVEIVAFRPNQIKSVDNGTPTSDDRFAA